MPKPSPPHPSPCQAWATCPTQRLAGVKGIFTDIDDTLTRDGAIEPAALQALHRLQQAGVPVIAITGRPMGWSRPFALDWPVLAIVAENGAVALVREATADGGLRTIYAQDEAVRRDNALRLQAVAQDVLAQVPAARLALDSPGRVTDIAIDHSEFVHLPSAEIDRVLGIMRAAGMTATVSSIHINGWFGEHSKWTGAQWILRERLGRELTAEVADWIYVGDSTNDQAMFERFDLSVGVANLMRFAEQITVWPGYLAQGERGQGFAEVAQALLAARRGLA